MAKRKNLKQRLKASDRRRKRRGDSAGPNTTGESTVAATSSVDVMGLLVQSVLSCKPARDSAVIAAIRACLRESTPNAEDAVTIANKLYDVREHEDVELSRFRSSLKQLSELASEHQDADNPLAFVAYLRLFA